MPMTWELKAELYNPAARTLDTIYDLHLFNTASTPEFSWLYTVRI